MSDTHGKQPQHPLPMIPQGYRSSDRVNALAQRGGHTLYTRPRRHDDDDVPPWAVRVAMVVIAVLIAVILLSSCSGCQRVSSQSLGATPPGDACAQHTWSVARSGDTATLRQTAEGSAAPTLTLFFEAISGGAYILQGSLPARDAIQDAPPVATLSFGGDHSVCLTLGVEDAAADPCLASLRGSTSCIHAPALP